MSTTTIQEIIPKTEQIAADVLEKAFRLMATAKAMTELYEANFKFVSKYVHATSRGHEAIQLAVGYSCCHKTMFIPTTATIACCWVWACSLTN